jgi:glycosyltransferase involved in cell wall biosynthesis
VRIGLSLVDLALGGAQVFFVELAHGLSARGHTVTYRLAAGPSDSRHVYPALKKALDQVGTAVRHPWNLWQADIIHLDGYHSLRRKLPYLPRWNRCVETYHSAYSVRRAGPLYPRHRIAVSQAVRDLLPLSAEVIYCGTECPTMMPVPDKRFDVAIVGRIHPVKNHLLFLAICEAIYERRGRCSGLLIGGHPQPGAYQQMIDSEIRRLGNRGLHLELTGEIPPDDLQPWLLQARVLLVTSESEGFGRMAIEAMACGVPLVANPVGGLLEIILPDKTGFLAERDDVDSFAAKTTLLLDNAQLQVQMGQKARALVEERFSLRKMVTDYEMIYCSVLRRV